MKKRIRILAACQDVGGCNAIYPVVRKLRACGNEVSLYASLYSAAILKKKNAEFCEIKQGDFDKVGAILDKIGPDAVLLGTSLGFSLEDAFVEESRRRKIKSIAIFDSWVNYSCRFSGPSGRPALGYLPDYICVSDNFVRERMKREGIPVNGIVVTGNPYFDDLPKEADSYTVKTKERFFAEHNIPLNAIIVSFFSQAIDKTFGSRKIDKGFLGYTQFDALKLLIKALKSFYPVKEVLLIVRPHPKENKAAYDKFRKKNGYPRTIISKEERPREIIAISDIVCGMFSVALIEAYLMKKNTLSIQPNLKVENPFILYQLGLAGSSGTKDEALKQIRMFIENNGVRKIKNFFNNNIGKATQNVIDFLCKDTRDK